MEEKDNKDVVESAAEVMFPSNDQGGGWYVVHVLSGHEQKVRNSMLKLIVQEGENHGVLDILIAQEEITEVRRGKKSTRNRKFFPGYILVRMEFAEDGRSIHADGWHFVNSINGVIGFLGGEKAQPLTTTEVDDIRMQMSGDEAAAKPRIEFEIGETVAIKDGAFANFEGSVEGVDPDKGKVTLLVNIFGRSTPVELEYWQIERQ